MLKVKIYRAAEFYHWVLLSSLGTRIAGSHQGNTKKIKVLKDMRHTLIKHHVTKYTVIDDTYHTTTKDIPAGTFTGTNNKKSYQREPTGNRV